MNTMPQSTNQDANQQRQEDHQLLVASLVRIAPYSRGLAISFYADLFAADIELRALFPARLEPQYDRMQTFLTFLADHYDDPEQLMPVVTRLGADHVGYGAEPVDYPVFVGILLTVLARYLGVQWPMYRDAWTRALLFVVDTMLAAAGGSVTAG